MKQHLFLLCGLPFSGKSALGRVLADQFGIAHVEVDRHLMNSDGFVVERRIERAEWISAYRAAYEQVEAELEAGRSVVFDAVSYRRTQRERIRRIAAKHGIPMTIIYMDVDPLMAREQMRQNRENPMRAHVPDADFDEVISGMQPPMVDERWIAYNPRESLEVWMRREIEPLGPA